MDRGTAMLKVVQDVVDGGKDVIPGWRLSDHAKDALKRGGPDGLKRYYERCLDLKDPQGQTREGHVGAQPDLAFRCEHIVTTDWRPAS